MGTTYNNLKIWLMNKLGAPTTRIMFVLLLVAGIAMAPIVSASYGNGNGNSNSGVSTISSTICGVYDSVKTIIFILALTLMVLGGALYAGANLMPSNLKGMFQGYGMGMIIGGVIGVIIVLASPYILSVILSASGYGSAMMSGAQGGAAGTTTASGLASIC